MGKALEDMDPLFEAKGTARQQMRAFDELLERRRLEAEEGHHESFHGEKRTSVSVGGGSGSVGEEGRETVTVSPEKAV